MLLTANKSNVSARAEVPLLRDMQLVLLATNKASATAARIEVPLRGDAQLVLLATNQVNATAVPIRANCVHSFSSAIQPSPVKGRKSYIHDEDMVV